MGYWCLECDNFIANDFDYENKLCKRCGSNNIIKFPGDMTVGDIIALEDISKDATFIQAMLDLREKAPIEYQLKMSQFKANLSQQKVAEQEGDSQIRCPYCKSTNVKKITGMSKAGSVALWGIFAVGKVSKNYHCNNCNSNF